MNKIASYIMNALFLYFAVIHLPIIYYAGYHLGAYDQVSFSSSDRKQVLVYLTLSIVLWAIIFSFKLRSIIKNSFVAQKNIQKIACSDKWSKDIKVDQ